MRLIDMREWGDVCKVHRPEYILEKTAAVGYWRSSISEHYWRLIPARRGFNEESLKTEETKVSDHSYMINFIKKPVHQNGHMMMETTRFEEMVHINDLHTTLSKAGTCSIL
jgi:hypothetical protein